VRRGDAGEDCVEAEDEEEELVGAMVGEEGGVKGGMTRWMAAVSEEKLTGFVR
jgi:hypothetical protein